MSNNNIKSSLLSMCSFTFIGMAFTSAVLTMTEPLFRVANRYDAHLFPEKDNFFDYKVSDLHIVSQNLFIATACFLGFTLLVSFLDMVTEFLHENFFSLKYVNTFFCFVSSILYISASVTLGKVGRNIRDYLNNLPIPVFDVDIDAQVGSIMIPVGLVSVLLGTSFAVLLLVLTKKRSGIRLE